MASLRLLTDDVLLLQCRWDIFRGSGPGGQKRNKTSNTVRLVHKPTGITVTAGESRSQAENKMRALRRLRLRIAVEIRERVDLLTFEAPEWFVLIRRGNQIEVSHRQPLHAAAGGLVLDLLVALGGSPSSTAINLGVSTSAVVRLLENEPALWVAANQIRAACRLPPLSHRR